MKLIEEVHFNTILFLREICRNMYLKIDNVNFLFFKKFLFFEHGKYFEFWGNDESSVNIMYYHQWDQCNQLQFL